MESLQQHSSPESIANGDANGDHQQNPRKRKRKTFSCDTCRRRKLKCDRELPVCGRCRKSGDAANCMYENPPEPNSKFGDSRASGHFQMSDLGAESQYSTPNRQAERLAALESRIAQIDPRLAAGEPLLKRTRFDNDALIEPTLPEKRLSISTSLYGGGFKTGFFGPSSERNAASYYPAIVKLYPQLKPLVSFNYFHHPLFAGLRGHIGSIRKNSKLAKKMASRPPAASPLAVLPDRETCTRMVRMYSDSIESTYHIFHGPTFQQECQLFWSDTSHQTEALACIMLLMISCVHVTSQHTSARYRGLSNVAREEVSAWIATCDAWLARQSRKHLTIESYQVRILLIIAKQINAVKRKQIWERASELLAFAISTGLHQDPSKIDTTYIRDQAQDLPTKPKMTPYEREMRRRLWATIVELELQASIDKGVPPSRLPLMADVGSPTILADEQFEPSSSALPQSEHRAKYTMVSYLSLSQESYRLRLSLAEMINTDMDHVSYDEVLESEERIRAAIAQLPNWTQVDWNTSTSVSGSSTVPAALLEIQLLQLQVLLHIPRARCLDKDSRSNLSRLTCVDVSARILEIHHNLSQSALTTSGARIHWLNLIREDVFRAIVSICFNTVVLRGLSKRALYIDATSTNDDLELFKTKVLALGDHYVQMWYILASMGMLRSSFAIENVEAQIRTVADDLTSVFSTVVNTQEEPSNEQTAAGALTALATPNSGGFDSGSGMTPLGLQDFASSMPYGDASDLTAWAFDDLWPFSNTGLSW